MQSAIRLNVSPIEFAKYFDDLNSPLVAAHYDNSNMGYVGWPEHWIRVLGKRIATAHFKEYSRKKHENEGRRAAFQVDCLEGDNNWPAILRALDDIGYETAGAWRNRRIARRAPGRRSGSSRCPRSCRKFWR